MTIKELYEDAIKHEQSLLAHYIFYLLQEGEITLESDSDSLPYDLADSERFQELWKSNVLGFDQIKVYSLKQEHNLFAFIFAKNEQEAINCYRKTFRKEPMNCHEMIMEHELFVNNRFLDFREWKKEFNNFPVVAGIYEKENLTPAR